MDSAAPADPNQSLVKTGWTLLKRSVASYFEDEALTRGAAIAFYTITSIGPILFIVVKVAGLFFGEAAASGALASELAGLIGRQAVDLLQTAMQNASVRSTDIVATVVGFVTLLITASGVFTEMQQALSVIWRAQSQETTVAGLLRARALSLGLVASLGFLLLVSLAIGALLTALGNYMSAAMALAQFILRVLNFIASFALITLLFAAIYKVLPDATIAWRDVIVGALGTSFLFTVGKFLISLYLGSSTIASGYGAAGGLILLALWVYYSAQTFLLGAEFTKVYAQQHGSLASPTD